MGNSKNYAEKIAVIDTETNWNDQVMSIGIVIADAVDFKPLAHKYYVVNPESEIGGMYSYVLRALDEKYITESTREEAIVDIKELLEEHKITKLFAYNAHFDKRHIWELCDYEWFDIMKLASNKNYNKAIPRNADCFSTGKLRRGYGVECIMRMLSKDSSYCESHNAVVDAIDELKIMELLEMGLEHYTMKARI